MEHSSSPLSALVPILVVFAVLVLRMRKMTGVRPMRLHTLWVRPAIVAAVAAALIYNAPPHSALQGFILLATLCVGALLGWHQGKLMAISIDSASGALQVKASMLAMILFFAVIALRMGLRPWLTGADSPVHAYVGLVTDGFLLFIVGFYSAQATEMFIRGRALLLTAQLQSSQPG